jgi:hypothetical protein
MSLKNCCCVFVMKNAKRLKDLSAINSFLRLDPIGCFRQSYCLLDFVLSSRKRAVVCSRAVATACCKVNSEPPKRLDRASHQAGVRSR